MSSTRRQREVERRSGFEAIVSEYEGALLRYTYRLVRNEDCAQDIVQDTLIKLFRNWQDDLVPSPQLASWLYRVAHNQAVDHIRKESRRSLLHRRQAEEQPEHASPDRGEGFRITEAAEKAAAALDSLSLRERQLVILKVYEEKSYREISEIAGLTVGNVGYILHHAMKKLAAHLASEEDKGSANG